LDSPGIKTEDFLIKNDERRAFGMEEMKMSKFLEGTCRYTRTSPKHGVNIPGSPFFVNGPESRETVLENLRLKKILKRAVERDVAPQSLIDSIRDRIRG
jgi:hypothetical protein